MMSESTIEKTATSFERGPVVARVREFGVLLLLGLIGITKGRG
jgi:hypothetical protein